MTVSSIDLLSSRISTAVASYGALDRADLLASLVKTGSKTNFTTVQADAFVAQYQLLDQLPNVSLNGFSAAVFVDKLNGTGKHVIAMRGTEMDSVGPALLDLVATDGLSIGGKPSTRACSCAAVSDTCSPAIS